MITTIAGMTIGVSETLPVANTYAGYDALTYTNIGYLSDAGEHGIEYQVVEFMPISSRGVMKFKGSFDYGNKTIELAYDPTDDGTAILKTALGSNNSYAFKIAYNDAVVEYFTAKVSSFRKATGTVNSMRMVTVDLNINDLVDTNDGSVITYLLSGTDRLLADTGVYLISV